MRLILALILLTSYSLANEQTLRTVQDGFEEIELAGNPPAKGCSEIISANYGRDPGYQVSLKNYPNPSQGCLDADSITESEANQLIASQNFTTQNATPRERRTLAAAIKRVQELNGGVLQQGVAWSVNLGQDPYPWIYQQNGEYSEQASHRILISRKVHKRGTENHYGHSVAQHIHEWAHLIGNRGTYAVFQDYMKGQNNTYGSEDYCMVSNYADNTTGEQFAEVFTAFITEPKILLNNSRTPENCKKVFEFFWDWLAQGHRVQNCL